jgi:cell division protein FtsX
MSEVVDFFMATMIVVMAISITITLSALCVMLVRSIYRDWDKL